MKALISGQAAIAVMRDPGGATLRTLDKVATQAWHHADIRRAFDGCGDVEEVSMSAIEEVDLLLHAAWAAGRALKLFLLLLDPAEPREELAEYAACVEELLVEHDVLERLEDYLLASTLPALVQATLVKEVCSATPNILGLFTRLLSLQPIIRQVRDAFDALPSELFGNEQDKVAHQECLTVEGAFREIVSVLSRGEDISYLMPTFAMRHHRFAAAMRQWIASVQYRSAKAPGTSGEPGEQVRVVKKATTSSARKSMLSRHLRDARIRRGLSVAEVAAQAGVSVASIYLWETGRTHPRDANLSVLCKVLKLPIRAVKAIVDG